MALSRLCLQRARVSSGSGCPGSRCPAEGTCEVWMALPWLCLQGARVRSGWHCPSRVCPVAPPGCTHSATHVRTFVLSQDGACDPDGGKMEKAGMPLEGQTPEGTLLPGLTRP